jgi:homoserine O-succinyltransferase
MTLVLAQGSGSTERCVRVGLVNNMPDSALAGTERQFCNVLRTDGSTIPVYVCLFYLPGIPRTDAGRAHLANNLYRSTANLPEAHLDALIVTGTEPRRPNLKDEPYWDAMAELFDWAEREGPPLTLSCLAAHAAVLHFDGIERQRLPQKLFGVFDHVKVEWSTLSEGLGPVLRVAHSRCNEISGQALARCGYQILTQAPDAGVDLFIRQKRNTWLLFQGHPEYDPGALGREFHRDVRRFLLRERDSYPALPENYFGHRETELLARFEARALAGRAETLIEEFPSDVIPRAPAEGWPSPAASVFRLWLQQIVNEKFGNADLTALRLSDRPALATAFGR